MLKFYLETNIDKAIEYGYELKDEVGHMLLEPSQQDLKFSIATAHSLKCDDLGAAIELYNSCMYLEPEQAAIVEKYPALGQMRGIISNNLGIAHFF